jgi:hypothetical protein
MDQKQGNIQLGNFLNSEGAAEMAVEVMYRASSMESDSPEYSI